MAELLPPGPQLGLFLTAALILAITPGPGVFYIVASSLEGGTRAGLLSVCGIAVGTLCHILFAAIGLTALIASLPQFIDPARGSAAAQFILLGLMLTALASITDGLYAVLSFHLTRLWDKTSHARRWPHRVAGCTYLMLGVASVLLEPPKI